MASWRTSLLFVVQHSIVNHGVRWFANVNHLASWRIQSYRPNGLQYTFCRRFCNGSVVLYILFHRLLTYVCMYIVAVPLCFTIDGLTLYCRWCSISKMINSQWCRYSVDWHTLWPLLAKLTWWPLLSFSQLINSHFSCFSLFQNLLTCIAAVSPFPSFQQ